MRTETREDFVKAIEQTQSMAEAAKILGMSYDTFRKYAQKFGLFNPNQSGTSIKKPKVYKSREDIFRVFDYNVGRQTVKNWYLLDHEYKCNHCGISEWNGKHLSLELEHINGNNRDNRLENIELLCPNCHSQTVTWRRRK